MNHRAWLEDNE